MSFNASGVTTMIMKDASRQRSATQSSIHSSLSISLPLGHHILLAQIKSTADSGEVAVGEAKYRFWVRQVPNLRFNTPVTHGLDLSWYAVQGAKNYHVYLKKPSDSQALIYAQTYETAYQIEDLYTAPHRVYLRAIYNNRPQWTFNYDDRFDDPLDTATPLNNLPIATSDTAVTSEDTSVLIDVLANDSDLDGDSLTLLINGQSVAQDQQLNRELAATVSDSVEMSLVKTFGGDGYGQSINSIHWTTDGGLLLAGSRTDTQIIVASHYVTKLDEDGNKTWDLWWTSDSLDKRNSRAITDDSGNIYWAFENQLKKLDSSGNTIWSTHAPVSSKIDSIHIDQNGDLIGVENFASGSYIFQYGVSGHLISVKYFSQLDLRRLQPTSDGGYIAHQANSPHYITKITSEGSTLWQTHYGLNITSLTDLIPTSDGGYLVAGTANFRDGLTDPSLMDPSMMLWDVMVYKLNSSGRTTMAKDFCRNRVWNEWYLCY